MRQTPSMHQAPSVRWERRRTLDSPCAVLSACPVNARAAVRSKPDFSEFFGAVSRVHWKKPKNMVLMDSSKELVRIFLVRSEAVAWEVPLVSCVYVDIFVSLSLCSLLFPRL